MEDKIAHVPRHYEMKTSRGVENSCLRPQHCLEASG
jgi:hypothetical protein